MVKVWYIFTQVIVTINAMMTKKKKDNLEARAGDRYYTICVKNSSISETLLWIGIHFLVEPEKKRIYLYMPICSHKRGNMHWYFMSTFWYKNWISAAPLSFHACWYNDLSQSVAYGIMLDIWRKELVAST